MLRNFMSTEMMPLKDLVVPMVWVYAEEVYHFMPTYNWDRFSEVFPTAWTASAYKGKYSTDILETVFCIVGPTVYIGRPVGVLSKHN